MNSLSTVISLAAVSATVAHEPIHIFALFSFADIFEALTEENALACGVDVFVAKTMASLLAVNNIPFQCAVQLRVIFNPLVK